MLLPIFIQRCLTHGVQIYPYQLKTILRMAESYAIPNKKLETLNKEQIEKYVKALYLSGQEMSNDWSKGHELLKELGFKESKQSQGHRSFITLNYE